MSAGSSRGRLRPLSFIRKRIPPRWDLVPVFAACVFVVFSWAIVIFLYKLPGWLKFLDVWRIGVILAYELVFSLLESAVSFALLLGLVTFPGFHGQGVKRKSHGYGRVAHSSLGTSLASDLQAGLDAKLAEINGTGS
jgi:hypothetical protein